MNLNKVFIAGRLTADPQLRTTPSGQSVTSFSLATNRNWTDRAGVKQESAEYHNIVVWGKQAEIANQYLTKGSLVLVEGRLQTRSWNDKQGQPRKTTEIVCERLQFGPRGSGGGGPKPQAFSTGRNSQPEENQPSIDSPLPEEIPVIDIDTEKEDIKPEDLPF